MKRLLLLFMVCLLAGCTHDEFNEPIKDSAMPDEIVHRTLSFDEFYITFSGNESLLGKQIQALAQTRNGKLNKSTTESGGTSDDDVEIMVDYYHDAVHGNETYSFVTREFKTKGDYLEKFVVTIENGVNKSGYLRYYPEGDKIEELFTGRVELTNASQTISFSNYFVKGIRDERTTYGVQKDCTMVFTFGYTRCSHSGNHEYGESCNRGLINDAYLYVLTRVFCTTTITSDIQEMPNQIIDINPGRTGGGGGTSSSTIKFENFVNILNTATKSWLLENYDIKLIVSGYLVQQNFSEESKQTATALLNFIVNDNVLKTNNNKLTEHIVRSSLMGSEFSAQQFMTFWSALNTTEKNTFQQFVNSNLTTGYFPVIKPSVLNFLNWAFPYLINNEDVSWLEIHRMFFAPYPELENNTIINPELITYDEELIQQPLPSLVSFRNSFPKEGTSGNYSQMESGDVYKLVGGSLYSNHVAGNPNYQNGCTLRGSRGLLYSNIMDRNGLKKEVMGRTIY